MTSYIEVKRICVQCGILFTAKTTTTKYCSKKCYKKAYRERKRQEDLVQTNAETQSKTQDPITRLQAKEFLTVKEVGVLLNCSTRSIYRQIQEDKIKAINLRKRMLRIRRTDIDQLFEQKPIKEEKVKPIKAFEVSESYTIGEVEQKFGISSKALYSILEREEIQKMKRGKFVYIQKRDIHKIFGYAKN